MLKHRVMFVKRRLLLLKHRVMFVKQRLMFVKHRVMFVKRRLMFIKHKAMFVKQRLLLLKQKTMFVKGRPLLRCFSSSSMTFRIDFLYRWITFFIKKSECLIWSSQFLLWDEFPNRFFSILRFCMPCIGSQNFFHANNHTTGNHICELLFL